ncbi:MAG: arsenic resistance protein [Pseudomonadota bacterium]
MTVQDPPLAPSHDDAPAAFLTCVFLIGAITLGGLVGLLSPTASATLSRGIDTTILAMIFLLLFELRLGSLLNAFQNVRFLALAWGANFLIIPIIGFGIASLFFSGQPLLFAGLMIYFLAPCTDWFLGFTRLARGDTELGAALIPINIMTQLLLFPLWLWLFANGTGLVDLSAMPAMLLQWFLIPLLAAQSIRAIMAWALPQERCAQIMAAVSRCVPFVLAALIFQLFASHVGEIANHLTLVTSVAAAVCLFCAATLVVGESVSRLAGLAYPQQVLLAMTMAARNAPLMIALTAIALPNQPLVLAVIVVAMLVEIPLLTALNQLLLKRRPER